MSIIGWLMLGLIAGFVASKIVNAHGEGVLLDIVLGGFIFNAVGEPGVTGLNLWSFVVATIGAIVVLILYHTLTSRRAPSVQPRNDKTLQSYSWEGATRSGMTRLS